MYLLALQAERKQGKIRYQQRQNNDSKARDTIHNTNIRKHLPRCVANVKESLLLGKTNSKQSGKEKTLT